MYLCTVQQHGESEDHPQPPSPNAFFDAAETTTKIGTSIKARTRQVCLSRL